MFLFTLQALIWDWNLIWLQPTSSLWKSSSSSSLFSPPKSHPSSALYDTHLLFNCYISAHPISIHWQNEQVSLIVGGGGRSGEGRGWKPASYSEPLWIYKVLKADKFYRHDFDQTCSECWVGRGGGCGGGVGGGGIWGFEGKEGESTGSSDSYLERVNCIFKKK